MTRTPPLIALLASLLLAGLTACSEERPASPEAVITVAKQMVADNRAEQLYTLIYTESDREKRVLREVGSLLGHLQDLAQAVNKAFPEEVAELRKQAEEAAANGQASSMVAGILTGQRNSNRTSRSNRGSRTAASPLSEQALTDVFASLMADPFAFLEEQEDRLGSEFISPDLAALTWDGKMLLPPLGVLLKKSEGSWYVMLPTNLPQIKDNLPDNDEFWQALPELVRVFDNMIVDLSKDVSEGKVHDLASLSEEAGKKALIPMLIAAYAIGKAAQDQEKDEEPAPPPEEPDVPDPDSPDPETTEEGDG